MSLPFHRTKEHLRDELRALLGFGSQTATTIQNKLMGSWLERARTFIYNEYRPAEMRVVDETLSTVANTLQYDWPDQIDYQELIFEGVLAKIDGTNWIPLKQGIDWPHDNVTEGGTTSFPLAFDIGAQLEIWPKPDAVYPLRIEGMRRLGEFRADLTDWAADTATTVGDIVIPTSAPAWPNPLAAEDTFYYEATAVAGDTKTDPTTEPTWPTTHGGVVVDDQVTWTAVRNHCMLDDELVLELALAWGKSHYRQADAEVAMSTVQQRLNKLKGKQHGRRRYIRGQKHEAGMAFPQVSDPFTR